MKLNKVRILNGLLILLACYFLIQRAPGIYRMFRLEGSSIDTRWQLPTVSGEVMGFPRAQKTLLVFWATWCGPCRVELARITQLVESGKLRPDDVIAVASDEDLELVKRVSTERKYPFVVTTDPSHVLYAHFNVEVTPTLALIDEHETIQWMTSGLTPTLELRLHRFFGD